MSPWQIVLVALLSLQLAAPAAEALRPDKEKKPDQGHEKVQAPKDQPSNPGGAMASTSRIVIISPATTIFTDGNRQTSISRLVIRATVANLRGPVLLSGELEDKDTHRKLPIDAFELTTTSALSDSDVSPVQISLKHDWVAAGNYTGILRIAAVGDTAGQDVKLDVSVRPFSAWWLGIIFLSVGAGLSWFAVIYAARQRQMAGNEILVARLGELLGKLREELDHVSAAGAPQPRHTLDHITYMAKKRLRQLLTDKELSVIAGVTVPPVGSVTVLDEVEGMNRIVQNGFNQLLERWNRPGVDRPKLQPLFGEMDDLGGVARPLPEVDQGIKTILAQADSALSGQKVMPEAIVPRGVPSEEALVHRVVFTTHLLDALSFLTVVVLGVYILIWRNPGFGSVGNLLEAFFWGFGLKLGTDAARLGPSDVRTTFGIKIPAAP
jgi:hypothetical protein